jgi:sarcosine oxidase
MQFETLSLLELGEAPWGIPALPAFVSPPPTCDAVVVGAGVTGLSAALALADRGVEVVVVDREVGGGATARSGGIVLGETLIGPAPGFDDCHRTLADWIARESIDCGFEWTGCLELTRGRDPSTSLRVPRASVEGDKLGPYGVGRDDRSAVGAELVSAPPWYDNGVMRVAAEVNGGVLDPVRLLNGLLGAATRAGARFVRARVDHLKSVDRQPVVSAGQVDIAARHIVMAIDAMTWGRTFDPWVKRTLTVALQTVPRPGLADAIGLKQPFYTRELPLLWGRSIGDGSLLFGRELIEWQAAAPAGELRRQVALAGERLASRFRGLHPCLKDIGVQRVWAGPTAQSATGVPAIVEDPSGPGVVWAGGYGGHGLAQAFTLGRRVGARLAT